MILFSIVIPVYNAEPYIERCIKSVLKQTTNSYEIIIVDDGSSDGSLEVCRKYENDYIHVFHQKNRGASSARNLALNVACGEYIQFLDSDDTLSPKCLSILSELIRKYNNPDLIEFRLRYHACDGSTNIQGTKLHDGLYEETFIKQRLLPALLRIDDHSELAYNIFNVLRVFKRSLMVEHSIAFNEEIRRWEDWEFALNIMFNAKNLVVCTEALYNYYGHEGGGLGGKYNKSTIEYTLLSFQSIDKLVEGTYDTDNSSCVLYKLAMLERCLYEAYYNETLSDFNDLVRTSLQNSYLISILARADPNSCAGIVSYLIHKNKLSVASIFIIICVSLNHYKIKVKGKVSRALHRFLP